MIFFYFVMEKKKPLLSRGNASSQFMGISLFLYIATYLISKKKKKKKLGCLPTPNKIHMLQKYFFLLNYLLFFSLTYRNEIQLHLIIVLFRVRVS